MKFLRIVIQLVATAVMLLIVCVILFQDNTTIWPPVPVDVDISTWFTLGLGLIIGAIMIWSEKLYAD